MRTKPLTAQARVALASGAPLAVVAWVSAVAALYLFAGAGAWAAGFTASGEVLGFLPDPAYTAGVSGCGAAEAISVAALAHAAVLPVAAVAVAYLVLREELSSGAAAVSFARGARRGEWLARSAACVSAGVVVPFAVMSIAAACVFGVVSGVAPTAVAVELIPRLAVAALVAASLACLSVAAFALLGVGPVAATVVIVLAVAGLVAQMSGAPVPTHMGALAITCGIGTASQLPTQALFAAVAAAAELAVARCALCGMAVRRSSSTGR